MGAFDFRENTLKLTFFQKATNWNKKEQEVITFIKEYLAWQKSEN